MVLFRHVHVQATELASARPGGVGIHLMRQYSQTMHYCRRAERNVLQFSMSLTGIEAGAQNG